MDIWQASLLVGAFAAGLLSWREPRGIAWITAVMASFFVSGAYWDAGLPHAPLFDVGCDVAVFFLVYFMARYRWEVWLVRTIQAMVLTNIAWIVLTASGSDPDHYMFAATLELLNWIALFIIGGGAAAQYAQSGGKDVGMDLGPRRSGGIRRALMALRSPRATPPWHER